MKIALPCRDNLVDGHFGHCEYFTVFSLEADKIIAEQRVDPPDGCGCKSNVVTTLADMGVKVMLAGNMGGGAASLLNSHGIDVYRGCSGDPKTVVEAWLAGNVSDSGTGCSSHDGCGNHG